MTINNEFYDDLGARWYEAQDDPVALLRAESRYRNPLILRRLQQQFPLERCRVLDVGCGAGFLSNYLAEAGLQVSGVDLSAASLQVARRYDKSGTVEYQRGDAYSLPYADQSFEAVTCMDFLEHVEEPSRVVAEAARVLQPRGLFFFYTFNRNPLSWLIAIKGVEWLVRNVPPRMHLYRLFVKPAELRAMCEQSGLSVAFMRGSRPLFSSALWELLRTGVVPTSFRFTSTRMLLLAYWGMARRA